MVSPEVTIVWEFTARAGKEDEFERIHGPHGDWAVLFKKGAGYLGTQLYRSRKAAQVFLVIDRWRSPQAFAEFKTLFSEEYRALDLRCEELTDEETHIGDFNEIV